MKCKIVEGHGTHEYHKVTQLSHQLSDMSTYTG